MEPIDNEFDYLLVLDFEAQCVNGMKLEVQEIIEFPVIVIDVKNKSITDLIFHTYIKPVNYPQLFPFCKELTGITQEQVDSGLLLEDALRQLDTFLQKKNILDKKFTFITCGDWDLRTCLRREATYKKINYKEYLKSWINIKKVFKDFTKTEIKAGMVGMLKYLSLDLEGRHHSGIDDSKNIAKIVLHFLNNGVKFTSKYLNKLY